jgi:hypothetical protein
VGASVAVIQFADHVFLNKEGLIVCDLALTKLIIKKTATHFS